MTHEAVGAAVTLAVCAAVDSGPLAVAAAVCASLLGSRLPDADQPGTRIYRRTRLERRSLIASLAGGALRLPMTAFAGLAQHRGATHWLLSAAAATIILTGAAGALWPALVLPLAIGVGCGYCAHLLADACTPYGAPLLGPFTARRVHLLPPLYRIPTGSAGDLLVLIGALSRERGRRREASSLNATRQLAWGTSRARAAVRYSARRGVTDSPGVTGRFVSRYIDTPVLRI